MGVVSILSENVLGIARRVRVAHEGTTCDCDDVQLADAVEQMTAALRAIADDRHSYFGGRHESSARLTLRDLGIPITEDGDE